MKTILVMITVCVAGWAQTPRPSPVNTGTGGGGGTGTVTVVGSGSLTNTALVTGGGTTTIQTPAATATMDGSGNISTPGSLAAAGGFKSGSAPPSVTPGTGGVIGAAAEGTAPSVGAAAGVDVLYADSTQHGFLASFNNGSYLPLVQGPASTTSSDLACWNATNGGLLKDCTAIPSATTATTQAALDNSTKIATTAYVDRNTSCGTTITTGTTATLSTCFTVNQEATAGTGVTYTLPTAAQGLQYCIDNGWNGSAANTGVLTFATSASGQFMVFTDGTLTATGGNVTSAGAARDGACVYGIDATHWMFLPHSGTWTKH